MEANNTWLDSLEGLNYKLKIWQSIAVLSSISCVLLGASTLYLAIQNANDFKNERLVLVPALQRKLVIPAESYISETFVEAASNRVVELQESWTYESVSDHYDELFKTYYGHSLTELTKANLISTNRIEYIKNNKMISTFRIDKDKSEYSWCTKLNRACALVTGTRRIYINNNEIYSKNKVSYLLLSESVWPTEDHPHALKFSRIKISDSSENSFEKIKAQFEAAKKGVLPNEA